MVEVEDFIDVGNILGKSWVSLWGIRVVKGFLCVSVIRERIQIISRMRSINFFQVIFQYHF